MKIKALVNPLSSVHSEVYSLCICDLYASFYGPKADFSATHTQDNLKQMVHSILDSNQALCASLEIYERKAKANEIFNSLLKAGWIESYDDKALVVKLYRFTKEGKVLAQTLYEMSNGFYTRKSRAVRSTKSCLESFYNERNVDYLLDAWSYSMQIMQEFEELINEIHEKRKSLLQTMATSEAVEIFLSEMQKRERELQQKLKTDSVLRYADSIHLHLDKITNEFPAAFWDAINPQIINETGNIFVQEDNPGLFILAKIREHIEVAIEKKNPELTQALNFFIKRTRSLLKTSINLASSASSTQDTLSRIKALDETQREFFFEELTQIGENVKVRVLALDRISIPQKIKVNVDTQVQSTKIPRHLELQSKLRAKISEKTALSALQAKDWVKEKANKGSVELVPEDINHVMGVMKATMMLDGMKSNGMVGLVDSDHLVEGLVTCSAIKPLKSNTKNANS